MTSAVGLSPQSWETMIGNRTGSGRYFSSWSRWRDTVTRLQANTRTAITGAATVAPPAAGAEDRGPAGATLAAAAASGGDGRDGDDDASLLVAGLKTARNSRALAVREQGERWP